MQVGNTKVEVEVLASGLREGDTFRIGDMTVVVIGCQRTPSGGYWVRWRTPSGRDGGHVFDRGDYVVIPVPC